jgi:endoglucanase
MSLWRTLLLALATLAVPVAALAQGDGYWHTSGSQILDLNNQQVRIAGINWYGFETTRAVAGGHRAGLQSHPADHQDPGLQYRPPAPLQPDGGDPQVLYSISYNNSTGAINSDLKGFNSLQILDKIITYAGTLNLKTILDNHRSEASDSAEGSGLWFTGNYPESAWINDRTTLATRYLNNPTVIGLDLRNEPHNAYNGGLCWDCGGT